MRGRRDSHVAAFQNCVGRGNRKVYLLFLVSLFAMLWLVTGALNKGYKMQPKSAYGAGFAGFSLSVRTFLESMCGWALTVANVGCCADLRRL